MHLSLILAAESSNPLPSLIIFMLIPVAMYFLLIRPQRRRQREAVALQRAIEVGDEVMTTSGVYGFITSFEGDIAWLEIDDNVQIRIAKQSIQRKVDTAKGETAVPTDDGTKAKQTKIDDVAADTAATEG
ncbi:MAG: preprotein translocase subunit YajC [Ilumatobacteraceae bacterium]|nr:preprotein translocase subunit YajC [Ilumatobacteraceae bacterium]